MSKNTLIWLFGTFVFMGVCLVAAEEADRMRHETMRVCVQAGNSPEKCTVLR